MSRPDLQNIEDAVDGAPDPVHFTHDEQERLQFWLRVDGRTFRDLERAIYEHALANNGRCRRRAAKELGIPRATFCDRVKRMGLP